VLVRTAAVDASAVPGTIELAQALAAPLPAGWALAAPAGPNPAPSKAKAAAAQTESHRTGRRAGTPIVTTIRLRSQCCRRGNTVPVTVVTYSVTVNDRRLRDLPNHVAELVRLAMTAPLMIAVH